eukprot:Rhum_TRINITY_DN15380_c1_g2::Rhum_TRINITY_DN15380_c1_g2_i1::g.153603::m.153603
MRSAIVYLLAAAALFPLCDSARVARVVVIRHGERQDHVSPRWAATAARAHDSPLSRRGAAQARAAGVALRPLLASALAASQRVVLLSSPLVRAVQTADGLLDGLGDDVRAAAAEAGFPLALRIENCLAETETAVRQRMMGTHPKSVPKLPHVHTGLCKPVLLGPSDLMTASHHVDVGYSAALPEVLYDEGGHELGFGTGERTTMPERVAGCLPRLLDAAHWRQLGWAGDVTLVLVSHGGLSRNVARRMTRSADVLATVGYCEILSMRPLGDAS